MKTKPLAAALLILFSLAARADDASDRAALRAIKGHYEEAANTGDISKIQGDLSKDVTGVMVTGESIQGYDGLVNYWKGIQNLIGSGGSYHVTVNADKTDIIGDVAVSRGTTDETVRLASGKELAFHGGWTSVCRREDGAWKVFRMEATMNPLNNVFTDLQRKTAKLKYGSTGAVAGVMAMLLMRLMSVRRKA